MSATVSMPLGLDPKTTRLAFVWARKKEKPKSRVVRLPDGEDYRGEACAAAFRETAQLIAELKDDGYEPFLYQEAPVVGGSKNNLRIGPTISQTYIGGATLAAAGEMTCRSMLVNNQSWKKRVLGAGNINKEEVGIRMKEVWPQLCEIAVLGNGKPDEDVIDAGALFLFGQKNQDLLASLRRRRSNG